MMNLTLFSEIDFKTYTKHVGWDCGRYAAGSIVAANKVDSC